MGKIKDMRGQRFGRLTVPKNAVPVMRQGHAYWPVICDCSLTLCPPVRGSKLRDGSTVSCGCWRADSEVRSQARRGPLEDEHYDDGMEAQRACYEADLKEPEERPGRISGEPTRENLHREAPAEQSRDLDRASSGDDGDVGVLPAAPERTKDALDRWIDGDADERPEDPEPKGKDMPKLIYTDEPFLE